MNSAIKTLIIYQSQTGNTAKAAEAIKRGLEREGIYPDVMTIPEAPFQSLQDYDLVFLGSGVGHFAPPKATQDWTWDILDFSRPGGRELGMMLPGKYAVSFVTQGGPHTGINEAIPAVKYLSCVMEHVGFAIRGEWTTVGSFKGIDQPPCQKACPIGQDVPRYVALILTNQLAEAAKVIRKDNPLPGVLARVCTQPCQSQCETGKVSKPVAIRALKRFAADYEKQSGSNPVEKYRPTRDERVAIIGSGPAGLTAAHYLATMGYRVTIFEAAPLAGGMLTMTIPDYRLPRDDAQRDIDAILSAGVEILFNQRVGRDVTIDGLKKDGFRAIFIATGAHQSRRLDIPGTELDGVIDGIDFLRAIKSGKASKASGEVVVLGGGNVAVDAARSAIRLGAKRVTVACLEAADAMRATAEEVEAAIDEGVEFNNGVTFTRITGKEGHVSGVECVSISSFSFSDDGSLKVTPVAGTERVMPADVVITAVGQSPALDAIQGVPQIRTTAMGTIEVDQLTLATDCAGVFAGGDATSGPSSVVEAVAAGKRAARSIDLYLRGEPYQEAAAPFTPTTDIPRPWVGKYERERIFTEIQRHPVAARINNFNEVELGFTPRMAIQECKRCQKCDLVSLRHTELRTMGQYGDTTGRPNECDLAELESKAAGLARWLIRERKFNRLWEQAAGQDKAK